MSNRCSRPSHDDRQTSKTNHGSRDQHYDHGAIFNVVPGPERIVPVIKQFRDMAPDAKREDTGRAEFEELPPHTIVGCHFDVLT